MMKIDERYKLHNVAGEWILMLLGEAGGEPTRVIAFNETAVLLWNEFKEKEFTVGQVSERLLDEFDVSPELALRDAGLWVEMLKRYGVVRDDS